MFVNEKYNLSRKVFGAVSIIGILITAVFSSGLSYYVVDATQISGYKRIVPIDVWVIGIALSLVGAMILSLNQRADEVLDTIIRNIKMKFQYIRENIKSILYRVLILGAILISAYIVELLYARLVKNAMLNEFSSLWNFAVIIIAYITFVYRKQLYEKAHRYFFLITMVVGIVYIVATPRVVGVSWDDQIHYQRTAYISWGANGKISEADYIMINYIFPNEPIANRYGEEEREEWYNRVNDLDEYRGLIDSPEAYLGVYSVAYIPGALALAFGRGLGFSYTVNFVFAKIINLFLYTFLLSYSIKILKRGKLIVAAIGLIPTNLFLVSAYAYDWWTTSMVILGYSLFVREIQSEQKISTINLIKILSIMMLGIMPKAIYFPLIFPMMLLDKEKYENPKIQRTLVVMAMLLLVATFALPLLSAGGGGASDTRANGSTVNSAEQIKFILTQPISYTGILLKFLGEYLSLDYSRCYLTSFAYLGDGRYYTLIMAMIVAACSIDVESYADRGKQNIRVKLGTVLGAFGSIVLAATALYISFTPVAHETILGCQYRYILPVVFPVLFMLVRVRGDLPLRTKANALAVIVVSLSMIFLTNMYNLSIMCY